MASKTIAVRFTRFSAALEEESRSWRLSQSSGSEHSAANAEENVSPDLSELVDLFIERECGGAHDHEEEEEDDDDDDDDDDDGCGGEDGDGDEDERGFSDGEMETKRNFMTLIGGEEGVDGRVRSGICAAVESAWQSVGGGSPPEGLKRRVMGLLRQKGFEAGLCKSRWAKTAGSPAGEHEYIDILIARTRYIIELFPATQFTVARPTPSYISLLHSLPQVIVCNESTFKLMVRLMCAAMRRSLKKSKMHVPPWRRQAYVQSKWLGPYKRTINLVSTTIRVGGVAGKSFVGFEKMQAGRQALVEVRNDGFVLHTRNLNTTSVLSLYSCFDFFFRNQVNLTL